MQLLVIPERDSVSRLPCPVATLQACEVAVCWACSDRDTGNGLIVDQVEDDVVLAHLEHVGVDVLAIFGPLRRPERSTQRMLPAQPVLATRDNRLLDPETLRGGGVIAEAR